MAAGAGVGSVIVVAHVAWSRATRSLLLEGVLDSGEEQIRISHDAHRRSRILIWSSGLRDGVTG